MGKLRQYSFKVGEWEINAVVAGSGPPILFLHGIGLSWQWWQSSLNALSRDFTVCAIDLPGSGRSSPLTSLPQAGLYKALVARAIETFTADPTIVVGHSLGGYVAVQAAMQDVPAIRGLFLVAPAGFGPIQNRYFRLLAAPGVGELLARMGKIGIRILLRSLVYDRRSVSEDMLQRIDLSPKNREQFLYQLRLGLDMFGNTEDAFVIKDVPSLATPVLLLWGKHDSVFPLQAAYQAEKMLQAQSFVIFEHSGHLPQLEETDRFNAVLRSFAGDI